jgi:hypothetical protein
VVITTALAAVNGQLAGLGISRMAPDTIRWGIGQLHARHNIPQAFGNGLAAVCTRHRTPYTLAKIVKAEKSTDGMIRHCHKRKPIADHTSIVAIGEVF